MKKNKKKSVIVAMSGGVDSSVAAYLLKKEGYEVIGMFMRLGMDSKVSENTARFVCNKLGIRFYPVNLAPQFKKEVVSYFIESYRKGLTPNPCVNCNKLIKFKELLKIKDEIGADFLATGHYIRLARKITNYKLQITNTRLPDGKESQKQNSKPKNVFRLFKGDDPKKDQSYFLYNLTQKQLEQILFPLAKFKKDDIRKIADKAKLPYLTKESQDVCFMNQGGKIIEHNDFLKDYIKQKSGPIKNLENKKIGEHKGLPFYTIGQRRGVEIGGTGPYYVVKKDFKTNTLYVVENGEDKYLHSDSLIAKSVNWILGIEPKTPLHCEAVVRYGHEGIKCKVEKLKSKKYKVEFEKPQRAITPGQSVVFYKGNEVLGGGIID